MALSLDLSLLTGDHTLKLIDNQSAQAVTGFFERGTTNDLYEEGAQILGTGYNGAVTISYVGGTGNDVVLNLLASPVASADFDDDGDVDGADFLFWQRGVATSSPALGDADGDGVVDADDLAIWKNQFGGAAVKAAGAFEAAVPEPHTTRLLLSGGLILFRLRWIY
jgi:hypothetical protein